MRHCLLRGAVLWLALWPAWWGVAWAVPLTLVDRGEVHFYGEVVDTSSLWRWRIASADQVWSVDLDDARSDAQGRQVFTFPARGPLAFLEGHFTRVAARGGPGMTPSITFNSANQPLPVAEGARESDQRFRARLPVFDADSGEAIGQLALTVEQGLGVARDGQSGLALLQGGGEVSPGQVSAALSAQLAELLGRVPGAVGWRGALSGEVLPVGMLANPATTGVAAVYGASLSDFELSWPAQKVPLNWRASLGVVVTVQ